MDICFFDILLFCIIVLTFYFDVCKLSKRKYLSWYKICIVVLTVISSIRYGVGIDTPNYMVAYEFIPKLQDLTTLHFVMFRFQPLYIILNSFSKTIYDDFFIFQVIESCLLFHALYKATKWLNIQKFYVLLFFYFGFYLNTLSALREVLAVSFCLYSIYSYIHKKWLVYYALIFLAILSHSGAVLFLILPIFSLPFFKKSTKRSFIIIMLCSLAACTFINVIFSQLAVLNLGDDAVARYSKEFLEGNVIGGSIFNLLKNLLSIYIVYMYVIKNSRVQIKNDIMILGLIYIIIDIITNFMGYGILYRYSFYLFVFYASLFVEIIQVARQRMVISLVLVLFIFYYQPIARYVNIFSERIGTEAYIPYCTIFSTDKSHYNNLIRTSSATDYLNY